MVQGFLLIVVTVIVSLQVIDCNRSNREVVNICSSGEPEMVGTYIKNPEVLFDGVPTFTNENSMSFFRNKGFWYLGNIGLWPPETHYRCVEIEGCNYNIAMPPSSDEGTWTATKKFGKDPVPFVTSEDCHSIAKNIEL